MGLSETVTSFIRKFVTLSVDLGDSKGAKRNRVIRGQ